LIPKELQIRIKNLILQRQKLREKFVADFWKGDQSPTIQIPAADLNPTDKKFLQKALDTVALYISDPEFNVILFSREMAMSRQQMHRKFRAIVDQSATEFIRVIRLKKAAELLSKKTSTVSEIAYDVGFSSLSYFTRSFQQQFGIAPSEYAENHSKT
jgi:AraC-like DNA-binding protein